MLGQIDRYIKQAVVDKNSLIASSALVSANQMVNEAPKDTSIVRRWVNEDPLVLSTAASRWCSRRC